MFSRILIKLIDEAIIPAITLIAVRFLSIIFLAKTYDIPFEFGSSGFSYKTHADFIFVNSYSTIAMVGVLALGLTYVLLKAYLFHDSHVKPSVSAKLFNLNLSSFIQTSFDVYSQGAIWWLYLLFLTISSGVMSYHSLVYSWVLYVSIALMLISTYFFVIDVEDEMQHKNEDGSYDDGVTVLEMEV